MSFYLTSIDSEASFSDSPNTEWGEMEECPECEGKGKVCYTCCGDNVIGTIWEDYGICNQCREHIGEAELCDTCEGKGEIKKEENQ